MPTSRALVQNPDGRLLYGRYQLGAALGVGSFGSVYDAWDSATSQRVAVKQVRVDSSRSLRRAEAEIKANVALQGDAHVLNMLDHFWTGRMRRSIFFVFPVADGSLQQYLESIGGGAPDAPSASGVSPSRLPVAERLPLFYIVLLHSCIGLAAMHRKGLIHRGESRAIALMPRRESHWQARTLAHERLCHRLLPDIKPGNILYFTGDGGGVPEFVVADLGLATSAARGGGSASGEQGAARSQQT